MGMDMYHYVGPYLKTDRKTVKKLEEIVGCSKCNKKSAKKFCSECGGEIAKYTQTKEEKIDHWEFTELINEKLFMADSNGYSRDKNHMVFLPNVKIDGISREDKYDYETESGDIPFELDTITKEVDIFKKFFEKEIEVASKMFGENYKVCWGVVTYCM